MLFEEKDASPLDRIVHGGFRFAAAAVVVLIVAVAPSVNYLFRKAWLVEDAWILIVGALILPIMLGLLSSIVAHRMDGDLTEERTFRRFALGFALALLACQAFVLFGARFRTGWDVWWLTLPREFANGDYLAESSTYFGGYPNQLFLYAVFSFVDELCASFGVSSYLVLTVLSCLCVTAALVMCLYVARELVGRRGVLMFAPIAFAYLGLNGWVMVPYSDSIGMFFTSGILYSLVCARTTTRRLMGVTAFTVIGYMVKPTIVFPALALLLLSVPSAIRLLHDWCSVRLDMGKLREARAHAIACAMTVVLLLVACSAVKSQGFDPDPDRAFSMTHFLMMGANEKSGGGYSAEDVAYSYSFDNPRDRSHANIERWMERLDEMGPAGVLSLGLHKALTDFSDGTFAWEFEGDFYLEQWGRIEAVQDWYGVGEVEARPGSGLLYETFCQVCWIAVLIGCAAAPSTGGRKVAIAQLALLMLMVFLIVFEARARYLFLYSPFFLLLALPGWLRIYGAVVTCIRPPRHR